MHHYDDQADQPPSGSSGIPSLHSLVLTVIRISLRFNSMQYSFRKYITSTQPDSATQMQKHHQLDSHHEASPQWHLS